MSPEVVLGTEEEDGELSNLMSKVLDVGGDVSRVVDLCRPPSEEEKTGLSRLELFRVPKQNNKNH